MNDYCCEQFAEKASSLPDAEALFERNDEDGTWGIGGCCGGGCFVVTDMKYCPFCGSNLLAGAKTSQRLPAKD